MTWSNFYLLCFFVGFLFSVLSFLGGATHLHLPARFHWPFHFGHHAGGMAGGRTILAPRGPPLFNPLTTITLPASSGGVWLSFLRGFARCGAGWVLLFCF